VFVAIFLTIRTNGSLNSILYLANSYLGYAFATPTFCKVVSIYSSFKESRKPPENSLLYMHSAPETALKVYASGEAKNRITKVNLPTAMTW